MKNLVRNIRLDLCVLALWKHSKFVKEPKRARLKFIQLYNFLTLKSYLSDMKDENDTSQMLSGALHLITTVYGPYAFGLASLLITWFTIVGPQLERQAIDFEEN